LLSFYCHGDEAGSSRVNLEKVSCTQTNFQATPRYEPGKLTIKLTGEGDLDAVDAIRNVLTGAHSEAQRLSVKEVVVDLTELEFLNSSGIKHFVSWLRETSLLGDAAYGIRLISSPLIPWQRRSLHALQCFAPKLLTIDAPASS
jgi:anti-anti-sigma factor